MGESNGTRRAPRKLSAEQKWEVFLEVTTKELTQAEAPASGGWTCRR